MAPYEEFLSRANSILYQIRESDKIPKRFDTLQVLYQSEIHFIDAIGINDGVSVSEVIEKLNITNGAITQISDKLIKKGMILKLKKTENKKNVFFKLTDDGVTAYYSHKQFHQQLIDSVKAYVDNLSPTQIDGIMGLLEIIANNLPYKHQEI